MELSLGSLQRLKDTSPAKITFKLINFLDRHILVMVVVINYVSQSEWRIRITKTNDGEQASLGQTAHEEHAGLTSYPHSAVQAHATATVDDEDEVEV